MDLEQLVEWPEELTEYKGVDTRAYVREIVAANPCCTACERRFQPRERRALSVQVVVPSGPSEVLGREVSVINFQPAVTHHGCLMPRLDAVAGGAMELPTEVDTHWCMALVQRQESGAGALPIAVVVFAHSSSFGVREVGSGERISTFMESMLAAGFAPFGTADLAWIVDQAPTTEQAYGQIRRGVYTMWSTAFGSTPQGPLCGEIPIANVSHEWPGLALRGGVLAIFGEGIQVAGDTFDLAPEGVVGDIVAAYVPPRKQ